MLFPPVPKICCTIQVGRFGHIVHHIVVPDRPGFTARRSLGQSACRDFNHLHHSGAKPIQRFQYPSPKVGTCRSWFQGYCSLGKQVVSINNPQTITIYFYPGATESSMVEDEGQGKEFTPVRRLAKAWNGPGAQDAPMLKGPIRRETTGKDSTPGRQPQTRISLPQTRAISKNPIDNTDTELPSQRWNSARDGIQQDGDKEGEWAAKVPNCVRPWHLG